jgi:glycosyltransferase involved in cell wall biosynthesis
MKKDEKRICFVVERIAHHSNHSGYDQLVKYINSRVMEPNYINQLLNLIPERIFAQLRRTAGPWYNSRALKNELRMIPDYIFQSNEIYHFLYGEDSYHYSGYFNSKKSNKIVVTYHHPPDKFDVIIPNKNHLKKIDALIAVSSQQVDYFSRWVRAEKIHLVPHGIDVDYFHPVKIEKKTAEKHCLFVGMHLRDYETLKNVIDKVNSIKNSIHFTIVTDKDKFDKFSGLKNTQLKEKLSERELLNLYRKSDVLLLPITDCTANNTLLEAMACGLPVVTNDVGGVRDYASDRCALFTDPGDADLMADQLIQLLDNDSLREKMSIEAREKALQYDWRIVATKTEDVYSTLC